MAHISVAVDHVERAGRYDRAVGIRAVIHSRLHLSLPQSADGERQAVDVDLTAHGVLSREKPLRDGISMEHDPPFVLNILQVQKPAALHRIYPPHTFKGWMDAFHERGGAQIGRFERHSPLPV